MLPPDVGSLPGRDSRPVARCRRQRKGAARTGASEGIVKEFPIKGGLVRHKVGAIHAVSNVSFSITEGETFGLVGESGCGKTTIGRMLVGLEPLTSGEIYFDDKLVSAKGHKPSRVDRRDRQMMFQDPYSSLDPRMKVAQILGEPLMIQHQGTGQSRATGLRNSCSRSDLTGWQPTGIPTNSLEVNVSGSASQGRSRSILV